MEKMIRYRKLAKQILLSHVPADEEENAPNIDRIVICDEERGHYQLGRWGWDKGKRAKWMNFYFRLKNGKFWIEFDLTEAGIANELLEAGVPREDIVLAFHEPEMRPLTEFAVA